MNDRSVSPAFHAPNRVFASSQCASKIFRASRAMNRLTAASSTGLGGGAADLNSGGFAGCGRPCTGARRDGLARRSLLQSVRGGEDMTKDLQEGTVDIMFTSNTQKNPGWTRYVCLGER